MRFPASSKWLQASQALRETFKRRRDKDRLVRLLEVVERAAIEAGREWGREEAHARPSGKNVH